MPTVYIANTRVKKTCKKKKRSKNVAKKKKGKKKKKRYSNPAGKKKRRKKGSGKARFLGLASSAADLAVAAGAVAGGIVAARRLVPPILERLGRPAVGMEANLATAALGLAAGIGVSKILRKKLTTGGAVAAGVVGGVLAKMIEARIGPPAIAPADIALMTPEEIAERDRLLGLSGSRASGASMGMVYRGRLAYPN